MFYDKFKMLCVQRGITPSKASAEIGLSNATPTTWKKRGLTPKGDTLKKIADYFGVSIEYLLSDSEGTEKAPAAEAGDGGVSDDDIKFALFGGGGEITDEMYEEVKRFAAFVKQRERDKSEGGKK